MVLLQVVRVQVFMEGCTWEVEGMHAVVTTVAALVQEEHAAQEVDVERATIQRVFCHMLVLEAITNKRQPTGM